MDKKNIDWSNLGFGYIKTEKRYVSTFADGKWDEGALIDDDQITMSECACVLQYAQTIFEGLKAYMLFSAPTSMQNVLPILPSVWKCLYCLSKNL